MKKNWYKSKTHWFNIFVGIIGILELNIGLLQNTLGDSYGVVFVVVAMIGMFLRTVTTTAIVRKNDV